MKICVTAQGSDLDAGIDPRFGRCQYFLFVDTDTLACEAVENPNREAGGGAGIRSGQLMAEHGATAVVTGHMGPNAFRTLGSQGIQICLGLTGSVREAVEKYKQGQCAPTQGPDSGPHQQPLA